MSTNNSHRGGGQRIGATLRDSRRAVRRLCRNGNSTTVSIPPEFLHAMNTLPGALVELVFDHEWGGFFVLPHVAPPIPPLPPAPADGATHGA